MTSTATLQAALDVMNNSEPSIGYSIAYPFGVIGPILCIYFMTRQVQADIPCEGSAISYGRNYAGRQFAGRTLDDITPTCRVVCRSRWSAKDGRTSSLCRCDL